MTGYGGCGCVSAARVAGYREAWGGCKQEGLEVHQGEQRGRRGGCGIFRGGAAAAAAAAEEEEIPACFHGLRMTFAMQVDGSKHLLAARKVSGVLDGRSALALALTNQDPVNLGGNGDDGELGCLGYQRTRQHSEATASTRAG